MAEFGAESYAPGEQASGVSEGLSEDAKQRFAAAAAAMQQARKDEKRAKKRDDGVAAIILQFLTDRQRTHLATLISRLVARDCPSPFLLAILSLVNMDCERILHEYLSDKLQGVDETVQSAHAALIQSNKELAAHQNAQLMDWMMHMELALSVETDTILNSLMIGEKEIDGTVLQLTTFVLQEFLATQKKQTTFETLQPVAIHVLQSLFEPFLRARAYLPQTTQEEAVL